jgi:Htaa
MRRERVVGSVLAVGALLAVPATVAAAQPEGAAVLALSGKAAQRLAAADVRIAAGAPADATAGRITLPLARLRLGSTARLDHDGTIRLRKGKRSVTLRGLRTTLAAKPRMTARLGKRRIAFAALRPARARPLTLDAAAGVASGEGMRATLTKAAARALRRGLRVRRVRAGRLGRVDVDARLVPDRVERRGDPPAPPQQPPAPAPDEPAPAPAIGHSDWVASTLPGSSDLKSFTNYLLRSWPAVPPATQSGPGSVIASAGAARIDPGNPYDHRLGVVTAARAGDGSVRIEHQGRIDYLLPAHSIDNRVADPEVVIAPGGGSARLLADGHSTSQSSAGAPPVPFTDEHLLDLDLSGVEPVLGADGTRTWSDVPAVVAASGQEELGYPPGTAWGSWTIVVPAASTDPGPAAVTGTSTLAIRPSWIGYVKSVPPAGSVVVGGGTSEPESGVFAAPASGSLERESGRGAVDLAGSVQYLKPGHGIDITIADTRVEIDGAASTLSALVTANGSSSRITMATLDLSAPVETEDTVSWTDVLASLTPEGAAVFGGSYPAGSEYGRLTLTLETA